MNDITVEQFSDSQCVSTRSENRFNHGVFNLETNYQMAINWINKGYVLLAYRIFIHDET